MRCDARDSWSQRRRPALLALLEASARGRGDLSLQRFDPGEVAWAIETGLGPLFFRAVRDRRENSAAPGWSWLKGADLTARVIGGDQIQAMAEILDALSGKAPPVTLLKGISIAEEFYPEAHLRVMRDLDFLVPEESLPAVEAELGALGYEKGTNLAAERYRRHHHSAPLYHPERKIWVEVHRALFAPDRRASAVGIFQPKSLFAQRRESDFHGRPVYRLSPELQLAYLAAHWAQEFHRVGSVTALVDAIYLLKGAGARFAWERLLRWVQGNVAATYLYLLLSYLERHRLVEVAPDVMRDLFNQQCSFGRSALRLAHALIDRFLVGGRSFGPLMSQRNVTIVWKTLLLPGPAARNWLLAPINLSLPFSYRIQ
ncbi:MAG TPA: nucleotidyltransferase family protein [Candidatus Acidoferrales bacterium]|nr:nucleotidyltransferase family protein [Candidatus Acidoferrales bacterium]